MTSLLFAIETTLLGTRFLDGNLALGFEGHSSTASLDDVRMVVCREEFGVGGSAQVKVSRERRVKATTGPGHKGISERRAWR